MMKALLAAMLCVGWALYGVSPAQSQVYPNKPIKMVVPFPPGGSVDVQARIISDRLGALLGQSVVIENHGGGAGGSNAAKMVAAAEPDGYTILITPGGALTSGPAVYRNIGYDPAKVFAPVGLLLETPQVVSVNAELPVKSLAEVVAYAKANPGKISWGTQGFGTSPHLLLELFKLEAGIHILHVPYRGTAPMLTAAVAGEVQMVGDPMTSSLPHIQSGKLRPTRRLRQRTQLEIAGCTDHGRGGLSEAACAILARRGGASRHADGCHRQAQRCARRKHFLAGNACAACHAWRRNQDRHPAGFRQVARPGTRAVDQRREGCQHHGGIESWT